MLANSQIAPVNWFFDPQMIPDSAYLVGGAVRDALLSKRREYLDLDFVLPESPVAVAQRLASRYQAGFVVLDAVRAIVRVVFPQGTVDFAQQEGDCIISDLRRRDFTVNAIAYHPHTGEILDPLAGCQDLTKQTIRMVSRENLEADPLRLLRAYRQAAQLGFTIHPETQMAIRSMGHLLGRVAAERVQMELKYLLHLPLTSPQLIMAIQDKIFGEWLPDGRGEYLEAIDQAVITLTDCWPVWSNFFDCPLTPQSSYTWRGIARLASLLNSSPTAQMLRLKYSREITKGTVAIKQVAWHPRMETRGQYFFFQEIQRWFPAWLLLQLAQGTTLQEISPWVEAYLDPHNQVAHPQPLIKGHELMAALNIPASKQVGLLLTEIAIARAQGKITTPSQAIELAQKLLPHLREDQREGRGKRNLMDTI
jgi:tRNA nucleotidyltransferase (CCA-adding enzyme)